MLKHQVNQSMEGFIEKYNKCRTIKDLSLKLPMETLYTSNAAAPPFHKNIKTNRKLSVKLQLFQSHCFETGTAWNKNYPILFKSHEEINAKIVIHNYVFLDALVVP